MKAGPIDRRLRDLGRGDELPLAARRAAEIIRAVDSPAPLGAQADARVRAALTRAASGASRTRRLLLPALTLVGIVGTGLGAAAALRWMRAPPATPAPVGAATAPAAAAAPKHADPIAVVAPAAPAPLPPIHLGGHLVRNDFVRAKLAIDPRDRRYRPEIPPDFARAHAGEVFSWRVEICVAPTGAVSGARLLDRVHPLLDRQVGRAIEKWRYLPAQQAGHPIHTCTALSYRLALQAAGGPPSPVVTP